MVVRASEVEAEGWMWRGDPHRAAIKLPAPRSQSGPAAPAGGRRLTVRSRRAGDRLWPLGAPGSRKLKEVLIDRGIPRWQRDRLPLLCWGDEIAWVPGVTIDHRFRLDGRGAVCLVELAPGAGRPPGGNQYPAREVHTTGGTTRFRGVVEPGPAEPAPPARHGASIRLARHAPGEETQL
jgi:tRNA(Ile)-lysidine synthetase-like protein